MRLTHVQLYEALKPVLPEDAARMIADVIPPAQDLATKSDVVELRSELKGDIAELRSELKGDIAELRSELKGDIAGLRAEMTDRFGALEAKFYRTGLTVVLAQVPLYVGMFGTLVTLLIRG